MDTLRELANSKGLTIGTCVDHEIWQEDEEYRDIVSTEFDRITPESCLNWKYIRPSEDEFDFSKPDDLVEFAAYNGMKVTGIPLVWHNELPEWLENGNYEKDTEDLLKEHVGTVVSRYSGEIDTWTVINEAVNDDGKLRDTLWLERIGESYIEKAFRWAAENTDAELFYNDYGLSYDEEKREKVYSILSDLLDRGVPVDGIGLQMHFIGIHAEPEGVRKTIEMFQDLGLEVRVTEMDVAYRKEKAPENLELEQARYYGEIIESCLDSGVEEIAFWGVRDSDSWINVFQDYPSKYTTRPLLFDEDGNRKKSYEEVREVISRL